MWRRLCLLALSALCVLSLAAGDASAQRRDRDRDRDRDRGKWELLGTQAVDFRGARDVIHVGRREGRFTRIALEARDHDIYILDLKVVFLNNEVQDIPVRAQLRRDQRTRPLDLSGGERGIRQIQIVYRARPGVGGYAHLRVYGEKDRDGGSGAGAVAGTGPRPGPAAGSGPGAGSGSDRWDELGCKKVGFIRDRDVIVVGRQEGRFRAIRLRVADTKVHMMDLKVVYANGDPDDIPVREEIPAGGQTKPLDLKGERRAIRQIETVYRSRPSLRGRATVCIDGLS
jgi:hypothetical protein